MKHVDLENFIKRTKTSKSTIYRFYSKNKDLFSATKMKGKKRTYPIEHERFFSSEIMFEENQILRQENHSMRNLIDCLVDKDSLQYTMWTLDWSFFVTVAYKSERNKKSCFKQMHGLFEHLNKKFGAETKLRLFFTSEPFANRSGYHNHFVFHAKNDKLTEEVYNEIYAYFEWDRVETRPYDKYKAGLFYMCKDGLNGEDWDYIHNDDQYQHDED
jgi:hypothetical protein